FVPPIAEFFGGEIDWGAAAQFLPRGESLKGMSPFQLMEFLDTLTPEQLEWVKRVLPKKETFSSLGSSITRLQEQYEAGAWENALYLMAGGLTDQLEVVWHQLQGYHDRTMEGAATGLAAIEIACQLALTAAGGAIGGRIAGGLFGMAVGSGVGAGTATAIIEIGSGNHDAGSILKHAGRDAVVTFITTYVGGAL